MCMAVVEPGKYGLSSEIVNRGPAAGQTIRLSFTPHYDDLVLLDGRGIGLRQVAINDPYSSVLTRYIQLVTWRRTDCITLLFGSG